MSDKIKIFIIDDSALLRKSISDIVESSPRIELLGTAHDPIFAETKFLKLGYPDVLILDLEMPRMDGLSYLKQLMKSNPLPVIICSSYALKGSIQAIEALSLGAIDIIEKPKLGVSAFIDDSRMDIIRLIISASKYKIKNRIDKPVSSSIIDSSISFLRESRISNFGIGEKIIAIGSSTGGVQILEKIIKNLKSDIPPILIVQHMPKGFTKSLAERLNRSVFFEVLEAENMMEVQKNRIIIAKGNKHLQLIEKRGSYFVELLDGPKINYHRPSVDVLFKSCAKIGKRRIVAFILTGMGRDGAYGLLDIRKNNGHTFAQNEDSCAVYGMPKEAVLLDAVEKSVTPLEMAKIINKF